MESRYEQMLTDFKAQLGDQAQAEFQQRWVRLNAQYISELDRLQSDKDQTVHQFALARDEANTRANAIMSEARHYIDQSNATAQREQSSLNFEAIRLKTELAAAMNAQQQQQAALSKSEASIKSPKNQLAKSDIDSINSASAASHNADLARQENARLQAGIDNLSSRFQEEAATSVENQRRQHEGALLYKLDYQLTRMKFVSYVRCRFSDKR